MADLSETGSFTSAIKALGSGTADEATLRNLLSALGRVLKAELRHRGLWETPPSYLGVFGGTGWEAGSTGGAQGSAFEELRGDCYQYAIVDRLRSLLAQLKVKPNVDGLIQLNVRHFLNERQKDNDPIGSQVFEVLRSAVRLAVDERELRLTSGSDKIRNDSVLAFRQGAEPVTRDREKLPSLVAAWNDDLLPDLVTQRGKKQDEIVVRLRRKLPDLREEGIEAFLFKDLVDPLKADVRARWAALLELAQGEQVAQPAGEGTETVRVVTPDTQVEERQAFRKLVDCVLTGIRKRDVSEKTRGYLSTLWNFLRVQASDGEERPAGALGAVVAVDPSDEVLSQRQLAERLKIPRDRLAGLFEALRELFAACQAAISGKLAVSSLEGESARRDWRHRPQ